MSAFNVTPQMLSNTMLSDIFHYFPHTELRATMTAITVAIENTEEGDVGLPTDWPNCASCILIMLF
jgi:hypothetical protein